jgi:LysM repeat protein
MQNARQVFLGIFTALISIGLTLGVFWLSMAEKEPPTPSLTLTQTPSSLPTITAIQQSSTSISKSTTPFLITQTSTPFVFTQTPTAAATLTSCPPPQGWLLYMVRSGDSLYKLALQYRITSAEIGAANCLGINDLIPGQMIYLPPVPTRTPVRCGPPQSWVTYIVQPGDTLYRLGQVYGVTVSELQKANCLSGSLIHIGQSFFVPPWSPLFPSPTYDPMLETPYSPDTPTSTGTQSPGF